jgi:hypothetical protein
MKQTYGERQRLITGYLHEETKRPAILCAGRDDEKQKPLGDDLLSQEVALQVPSALARLTAGFGMGPGVPTPLKSPRDFSLRKLDC